MPLGRCAPFAVHARARYRTLIIAAFVSACVPAVPVAAQSVDVSSATRLESIQSAMRARDPQAAPTLAAGFAAEPVPNLRAWTLRAIAALGAPQGVAIFETGLLDPSPLVRMAAAEALAKTQGADAVTDLSNALAGEKNAGVRHAIAQRLGSLKTPESAAALQQALAQDPDPNVRLQAARSLQRHGGAAKQAARSSARNDKDPRVRAVADEP